MAGSGSLRLEQLSEQGCWSSGAMAPPLASARVAGWIEAAGLMLLD
jgi:hypothetical protein